MYSAGLWLMPLRLGTKIMPVGQSGTMNCASWKAPEGMRSVEKPCAAAARSTAPITAGLNSTGWALKRSVTETPQSRTAAADRGLDASPRSRSTARKGAGSRR